MQPHANAVPTQSRSPTRGLIAAPHGPAKGCITSLQPADMQLFCSRPAGSRSRRSTCLALTCRPLKTPTVPIPSRPPGLRRGPSRGRPCSAYGGASRENRPAAPARRGPAVRSSPAARPTAARPRAACRQAMPHAVERDGRVAVFQQRTLQRREPAEHHQPMPSCRPVMHGIPVQRLGRQHHAERHRRRLGELARSLRRPGVALRHPERACPRLHARRGGSAQAPGAGRARAHKVDRCHSPGSFFRVRHAGRQILPGRTVPETVETSRRRAGMTLALSIAD